MPDDFTFDDDELRPDDLRDEIEQPSGDDAESAPPWDVLPGDAPPAPDAPADVTPPWSALPGDTPPAPAAPAADAPWGAPVSAVPSPAQDAAHEHADLDFLFDDDFEDALDDDLDDRVTAGSAEDEPQESVPDWVLAGYASAEEAAEAQRDQDETTPVSSAVPEWLQSAADEADGDTEDDDLAFDFDDEEEQADHDEPTVVPAWVAAAAAGNDEDLVFDFDDEPDEQAAAVPDWVAAAAAQVAEDDALEDEGDVIEAIDERDEDETAPDWAHVDAQPGPERPAIRRIEIDDAARLPDWVRDPTAEPGEDIPEGLTYDEWEALMDERERAAQEPPAPAAAPDDMTQVAPPVPGMPEPPMPDFGAAANAAEPPADAADIPDWAKTTSFDVDPFTQPFEISAPEPAASAEPGDLPDWMTGDSAPDMDWDALFGAPAPASSAADDAEPQIKRIPTGDTGQLVAGVDADWLEEDEAGDDTGGDDEEIRSLDDVFAESGDAPGDEGERDDVSLEPAEMPDWFADEGIDDAVPGPEDIPFPDLELDDTMPQSAWEAFEMRADAEAASGDFVERFDPLEPDEFPAADQPEPGAPPRDEALPDWIIDSALSGDAGLPDDLSADGIWTMDMIPDQPIPGVAGDNLDWLDDISPDDVAARDVGESLPPLPDIADIVPVEDEDDLLRAAPLDSSALDDLLSTSALTVHEPQMPARAGEPDVDFDALFNELPDDTDAEALFAGAGTAQLEAWFAGEADDAALLGEQAAGGRVDREDEFAALSQDAAREAADTGTAAPASRLGRFRLGRKHDREPAAEEIAATGASDQGDTGIETPESPAAEPLTAAPQPEWVEELRPVDLPVTVKAGGVQADFKQKRIADLPDRLRAFRETALPELAPPDKLPPAGEGPLAGIAGALPLPGVLLSGEVARIAGAGLVITAQQQARADRLQMLLDAVADDELESERDAAEASGLGLLALTEPDEQPQVVVAPKAPPPERRQRRRLDRWLVMLIMLAALVGPFITDALHVADDAPALSGTRRQVARAVARVRPGDYVLFAFEYGPPTARELDGLADAVLRDVLARRAIPITLSTSPAGALHAETVITALVEDAALLTARDDSESALTWGEDYVLLGYLPGEAVGVRALSTPQDALYAPHSVFDYDLRGDETGLPAIALDRDIALLVVIGDESDDVRTWAEQLSDVTVRKVALVTAAIEPLTTPYVHADGGYAGYLAGARDAYSYNAARNAGNRTPYAMPDNAPAIPNPEQSRWQSMALGALLAALVIGGGLFINLLRGLLRRRHR